MLAKHNFQPGTHPNCILNLRPSMNITLVTACYRARRRIADLELSHLVLVHLECLVAAKLRPHLDVVLPVLKYAIQCRPCLMVLAYLERLDHADDVVPGAVGESDVGVSACVSWQTRLEARLRQTR
jgi:hypothetical protein